MSAGALGGLPQSGRVQGMRYAWYATHRLVGVHRLTLPIHNKLPRPPQALYCEGASRQDFEQFSKKKLFGVQSVLFVGSLIPLFWTSGDICPGLQSQGRSPRLHASPVCNGFLRFTSGVTPAELRYSSISQYILKEYF